MLDAKPVSTLLFAHFKLSSQLCSRSDEKSVYMSKVPYANAVRCLMYLMVCTRLDISHVVSVVSRFMVDPGKEYWNAVKWIFRYLTGTRDFGILFDQRAGIEVVGYVDSNYAGDLDSRKSTTGYVFRFVGGPICWKSTLQDVVALSTT